MAHPGRMWSCPSTSSSLQIRTLCVSGPEQDWIDGDYDFGRHTCQDEIENHSQLEVPTSHSAELVGCKQSPRGRTRSSGDALALPGVVLKPRVQLLARVDPTHLQRLPARNRRRQAVLSTCRRFPHSCLLRMAAGTGLNRGSGRRIVPVTVTVPGDSFRPQRAVSAETLSNWLSRLDLLQTGLLAADATRCCMSKALRLDHRLELSHVAFLRACALLADSCAVGQPLW